MKNYPLLPTEFNYRETILEVMIDEMATVKPRNMLHTVPDDNKPSTKYNSTVLKNKTVRNDN